MIRAMVPGLSSVVMYSFSSVGFGSKYLASSARGGWISGEYITASGSLNAACFGEQTARQRWLK